jgi:hypothetical protein
LTEYPYPAIFTQPPHAAAKRRGELPTWFRNFTYRITDSGKVGQAMAEQKQSCFALVYGCRGRPIAIAMGIKLAHFGCGMGFVVPSMDASARARLRFVGVSVPTPEG